MNGGVWRWAAGAAAVLWAGVVVSSPAAAQTAPPPQDKWGPFIDFEGRAGTQRNIGEGDLFAPLWQDPDSMVFGDLRTRFDDHNSGEGNAGLGIRHMLDSGWNLGGYGYFDRRHSPNGFMYNQVTMGAEALSVDWDVRANVYHPEGRVTHDVASLTTATVSGTSVIVSDGQEKALGGFDGEVGWRVPVFAAIDTTQLRVFAGGYRFVAGGAPPVSGPRGRVEMVFDEVPHLWEGARLSVGAEVQNDAPRGTQAFAIVRLRIPLEFLGGEPPARLTPMERRMTDPVVRDVDIVTQAGTFATETATQTANGSSLTVVNSNSTSGANLPGAVTAAGSNSTVLLSGTFNTTATVALNTGQTLTSGTVAVRTPSGRTATVTTSATIADSNGAAIVTINNNNATLSNLTLNNTATNTGTGPEVVAVGAATGVTISNNTITSTITNSSNSNNAVAIEIRPSGAGSSAGVTLANNRITATTNGTSSNSVAVGVDPLSGATATVTISGNTINSTAPGGGTGFSVALDGTGVTVNTSASTGNVRQAGVCEHSASPLSGSISFTDGSTCP